MEAHVVAVEPAADHTADDVLAAVLLHMVKAALPVDLAFDRCAEFQGRIAGVGDDAGFFVDIQHLHAAQTAGVGRLTAAFGIECGTVKGHEKPVVFARLAIQYGGGKAAQVCVLLIEFFGHKDAPLGGNVVEMIIARQQRSCNRAQTKKDPGEVFTRVDV